MKIFALNLCMEFGARDKRRNYEFAPISFAELMGYFFKGIDFERQQFYVEAEPGEGFMHNVFELQANEVWREVEATVCFLFPSPSELKAFTETFVDLFKPVDAAGGLVVNEKEEYLLIYNRNRWTLPKGSVEWREEILDAAQREVKEETGLENLEVLYELEPTYHTFRRRRKWVLKTTYWYKMKASSDQVLVAQAEENIEAVAWKSKSEWLEVAPGSYPLVRHLFENEFAKSLIEE